MSNQNLKDYLLEKEVKFSTIKHTPAYTAPEIAAYCHISGKFLAKVVIVKVDDKFAMVVEPAHEKVNFKTLEQLTGGKKVVLASESEFKDKFPDCELGAMSPFGNLYDMDVYVADSLAKDDLIAFNAGSHTELIKMSYKDFERLVHPKIIKH